MFPILGSDLRAQLPAFPANSLPFQQVLALFTHMAVSINLPTDPFYLPFYTHNKNSTRTTFYYKSVEVCQIATNLCTCHDSTTVMASGKICSNYIVSLYMETKRYFHDISILKGEALVE